MRKSGLALILAAMLMTIISACGSTNEPTNSGATPSQAEGQSKPGETVEIRIGVPEWPGEKENVEAVIAAFEKKYPDIKVKTELLVGDYVNKLIAQAASEELTDVVWVGDFLNRFFVTNGVLAELDPYMDKYGVDRDDIYPGMLGLGQLDGKTYFLPRDYNHVVTFVNTSLLKAEGLELPSNDWTWETFMDYVKKTTKKDASGKTVQWGVSANPGFWAVWTPMSLGWGGNFLDLDNKKVNFSNPEVVTGFKTLWDLSKDGYALDPNGQYPEDMFSAGKVAFYFSVRPGVPAFHEASKAKGWEWDVVPFPKLPEKHVVGGGTSGYGVYAKSKHVEAAAAFVSFIATTEGQKALGATGSSVPVLKSLMDDPIWRSHPVEGKNQDAFVLYPEADITPLLDQMPIDPAKEVESGITEAMNKYLLGKSTVEEALKELDEKVNQKWN